MEKRMLVDPICSYKQTHFVSVTSMCAISFVSAFSIPPSFHHDDPLVHILNLVLSHPLDVNLRNTVGSTLQLRALFELGLSLVLRFVHTTSSESASLQQNFNFDDHTGNR